MAETIIVWFIVAGAVGLAARFIYRTLTDKNARCGCETNCDFSAGCRNRGMKLPRRDGKAKEET